MDDKAGAEGSWMAQPPGERRGGDRRAPQHGGRLGDGGSRRPGDEKPSMPRNTWIWFVLILVANFLLVRTFFSEPDALTVPYTVFKQQVEAGNVEAIYNQGQRIEGRFVRPVTYPPPPPAAASGEEGAADRGGERPAAPAERSPGGEAAGSEAPAPGPLGEQPEPRTGRTFETTLPTFVDPGLEALLIDHGVEITAEPISSDGSPLGILLFGFGPAILIIAFYVWLFRRAAKQGGGLGGGLMGIGRSKARRYDAERDTRVTFDDVAGIDEVEAELVEIVDFLKSPEKYTRLGGTAPKGVLLVGAPDHAT